MTPPDRIAVLNQLFRRLSTSLPVYASQVRLWIGPGEEEAAEMLQRLAADDQHLAQRLAEVIRRAGGRPAPGVFPPEYTALHDISARYVLGRVFSARQSDLAAVRCLTSQLGDAAPERTLLDEIIRTLEAHLQNIECLLAPEGSQPPRSSAPVQDGGVAHESR